MRLTGFFRNRAALALVRPRLDGGDGAHETAHAGEGHEIEPAAALTEKAQQEARRVETRDRSRGGEAGARMRGDGVDEPVLERRGDVAAQRERDGGVVGEPERLAGPRVGLGRETGGT